jgi:hypothetical protein
VSRFDGGDGYPTITYWEIWNEPDAPKNSEDPGYGCWGNPDDPSGDYFGGRRYGEVLIRIRDDIRDANPNAQVVLGGLMLPCKPDAGCLQGYFLQDILDAGAGSAFDIMAYHAYPYWGNIDLDRDLEDTEWGDPDPGVDNINVGVINGKFDFIGRLLYDHQLSKPMMMNEGALVCVSGVAYPTNYCDPGDPPNYLPPPGSYAQQYWNEDQSNYLLRQYVRLWARGAINSSWYHFHAVGWDLDENPHLVGLKGETATPTKGYTALAFLAGTLRLNEGVYYGQLASGPALEGYRFRVPGIGGGQANLYDIYWVNDGSTVNVLSPSDRIAVYDEQGTNYTTTYPPGSNIPVYFDRPIIIKRPE